MSTRTTTRPARRPAALTIAPGLAPGVAACSAHGHRAPAVTSQPDSRFAPRERFPPGRPLAELRGQGNLSLTTTSAKRDRVGYVTVRGNLKDDGTAAAAVPSELRGNELKVLRAGPSLGGTTLVGFARKKRYYVLRDTEGHPLTTTGLSTLQGGASVHAFMQFPSPESSTVGFQLPLFDTANITISK